MNAPIRVRTGRDKLGAIGESLRSAFPPSDDAFNDLLAKIANTARDSKRRQIS
ncbi:MAG: hypothetical protein RQ833_04610 [Sphingomonadaceae bacterium]|nr:hypothetical protein [Sphingomonadaceae bacterium]